MRVLSPASRLAWMGCFDEYSEAVFHSARRWSNHHETSHATSCAWVHLASCRLQQKLLQVPACHSHDREVSCVRSAMRANQGETSHDRSRWDVLVLSLCLFLALRAGAESIRRACRRGRIRPQLSNPSLPHLSHSLPFHRRSSRSNEQAATGRFLLFGQGGQGAITAAVLYCKLNFYPSKGTNRKP